MRKRILILGLLMESFFIAFADEGMWIPLFLNKYNIEQMQKEGFKLSAKDIYDVNDASMKDAIVIFGGGCTAELISGKGLLLTNHHCGFSSLQSHTTVQNDYLSNGFWAMSQQEELPNPGLTVTFLVYMDDVTDRVNSTFSDKMPYELQLKKIDSVLNVISKEAVSKSDGKYQATVEPFFNNNQFILIVTQVYRDVRLVGAPPSSIGKFGGDTDNWVWPRHTGDFMMFRIYADKNNNPAQYSPDNVPLKPKKFFDINIQGVKEGDFTMVMGYPGYTQEYIPSYEVDNIVNVVNPLRIEVRQARLDLIDAAMNSDKQIRIQYAAKQAGIANGWKKWIGQDLGLQRVDIMSLKQNFEQNFQKWADTTKTSAYYRNILPVYMQVVNQIKPYEKSLNAYQECIFYSDLWKLYKSISNFTQKISNTKDEKTADSIRKKSIEGIESFFKNYNVNLDKQIFAKTIALFFKYTDQNFYPSSFATIKYDFKSDYDAYANSLFENSILTDKQSLQNFISAYNIKPQNKKDKVYTDKDFSNDPIVKFFNDFEAQYNNKILPDYRKYLLQLDSLGHLYMQAQMKYEPNKVFYPDANFTMRISYGKIKGFKPRDGIIYDWYTTLDGVIEKDNPEIYDYDVTDKLKELYANKNYGEYADKIDGKMHVCFIATNHTSGGNSGSPVINAYGQLIGLNFDRCWESTMSDIDFDENYCRNIALDIRYVLFIVDKYAGASYLLNEMNIIK